MKKHSETTEELTNWASTMDASEWVLETNDHALEAASEGRNTATRKKNQTIVWAHLFKKFKTNPKGRLCLDLITNNAAARGDPQFATNVWKALVKIIQAKWNGKQAFLLLQGQVQGSAESSSKLSTAGPHGTLSRATNKQTALGGHASSTANEQ